MFAWGDPPSHANPPSRTEYLMYEDRIRQGRNCFMNLNSREDTIEKVANNIGPILINSYSVVLSRETVAKSIAEYIAATAVSSEYGTDDKSSFQSFLRRLSNSETERMKPKIYNKERIRLKFIRVWKNVLSLHGFLRCWILTLTILSGVSNGENVQNCPGKCSCETFATPTVSSVQNIWPTLLASSIYPDTLSIPFRGPTSFEALISSILTDNNTIDDPVVSSSDKSHHVKTSKGFYHTTGGFSTSQIHPGEVSIDCSNRRFNNFSTISSIFDQQLISSVVKLDLSSNAIKNVRREDFEDFSSLRYLNLAANQLTTLAEEDAPHLPNLILLSLHGNRIYDIHKDAFLNVSKLQVLDLTHNYLSEVPEAINKCTELKQIFLGDNRITYIKEDSFSGLVKLQWVDLARNPLLDVHNSAFVGLPSLVKLILESVRDLDVVPSFNGTSNVEAVRIDRASLAAVPPNICAFLPHLKSLNLHLNVIHELPDVNNCKELRLLDLSNNKITDLGHKRFVEVSSLHDLLLQYNFVEFISNDAFVGLTNLQVLNLEYNRITIIEPDSFLPLINLEDINLGNNLFPEIPSVGLERVVILKAHNNRHLRIFPGPESFPSVHSLILSYAYHCCPFLSVSDGDGAESSTEIQEEVVFSVDQLHKFDPAIWNHTNVWPHIEGIPTSEFLNVWAKQEEKSGGELVLNGTFPLKKIALLHVKDGNISKFIPFNGTGFGRKYSPHNIQCIPQPGPFMPCRDLFDWWTLRCGVWLVFLLALMGNGVVVVVLVSAYSKMDVPRFLVSNLALADFFMGIYLGFLAVVDASTLGDFRMYAIPWQMSAGCQLAGFLGVLSSELSVYTLTVITMERNYAITHAMHLNKRLSLKHAAYIMAVGWVFAVTMAVLPLAGISDYRKFAVCLPFETDGAGLEYIVFLMLINGVAFLILMGCYLKIYCAIRGSQAWNSNDSRIAKRMALLVFTDFICWAPIAFFSLSAAFGLQLISLEGAKVFTVFVLPLNSCCNPFLYALLTKQFKKDCVMLCKAIEESRVTRGIGRCRHSSNFSNRQTPVNTNSALDQNSKEDHHGCNCKLKDHQIRRKNVAVRAMRFLCCQSDAKLASASGKSSNLLMRSPLKMARATTLDSSKMNSSWSWRGQSASNLRLLELRKQTTLDLARKSSQESSLSSSRNDSSGTTGSTVTWGISRSSVSSDTSSGGTKGPRTGSVKDHSKDDGDCVAKAEMGMAGKSAFVGSAKPRLQRQRAVDKDPGSTYFAGNELRCPLHARGDNLSCVYEQASLEEEDSNEVFLVSQPPCITHKHTHKRSLSDGLLCGTLLSLSAPTPQLISSIAPSLQISKSMAKEKNANTYSDSSEVKTESYDDGLSTDDAAKPDGLLETHFPIDTIGEVDPLLHKKSFSN